MSWPAELNGVYSILSWRCKCEYIWPATYNCVVNMETWCPRCSKKERITFDQCIEVARNHGGKCLSSKEECETGTSSLLWECIFGHQWNAQCRTVVRKETWCGRCYFDTKILAFNEYVKIAIRKGGMCLSFPEDFKNSESKLWWQCKNGHKWKARCSSIKGNDSWCKRCKAGISKAQRKIYDYITKTYQQYEVVLNDVFTIAPMHLDIYIPELKVAIEYDGEYWHYSEWAIKEKQSLVKMARKDLLCESMGIKLLRIRESDWINDKDRQIKNIIEAINCLK